VIPLYGWRVDKTIVCTSFILDYKDFVIEVQLEILRAQDMSIFRVLLACTACGRK
jgi:hypothetical protein